MLRGPPLPRLTALSESKVLSSDSAVFVRQPLGTLRLRKTQPSSSSASDFSLSSPGAATAERIPNIVRTLM